VCVSGVRACVWLLWVVCVCCVYVCVRKRVCVRACECVVCGVSGVCVCVVWVWCVLVCVVCV
jgi:hypothetical protein